MIGRSSLLALLLAASSVAANPRAAKSPGQAALDEGKRCFDANDDACAEHKFAEALRLDPSLVPAYTQMAALLYKQYKFADAVALLRRCPDQSDFDVRQALGLNLFKTTRPPSPEAIGLLEAAIKEKPGAWASHLQLGQHYLKTDQKRAAAHFEAFFKFKPASFTSQEDEIRLALANAYFYSNDFPKALPLFERALPDAPRKPNIYFNLATCLLRAARPADAERVARQYIAARPDDPRGAELLNAILRGGR